MNYFNVIASSMPRRFLALVACLLLGQALAWADEPDWEAAPLSLDAKALAESYANLSGPEGQGAYVIHEADRYVFDKTGSALHSWHLAVKILNASGIDYWGTIKTSFQPWRQEKPLIRARVIASDGSVSVLDPKTVSDSAQRKPEDKLYTDSHILDAPLPNLAVGSLIEFEVLTADRSPLLSAGSMYRVYFTRRYPIGHRLLSIDCPESGGLRFLAKGTLNYAISDAAKAGRRVIRIEAKGLSPDDKVEPLQSGDQILYPMVDFGTSPSWASVAAEYQKLVEPILGVKTPPALIVNPNAGEATPGKSASSARMARISMLLSLIQRQVRYTGIHFGQNAIVPYSPNEVFTRGYGDCKDQAALLVNALRSNGIKAQLALLLTGPGTDLDQGIAGFGMFDHAIAYLPDDGLWIDPTADFYPPGILPSMDQGRRALIIAPTTKSLTETSRLGPKDNYLREEIQVYLAEYGPARVVERTSMSGDFEASYRHNFLTSDPKAKREQLERYVKNVYRAKSMGACDWSDPRDQDKGFSLSIEGLEASRGYSDEGSASVGINFSRILGFLPETLRDDAEAYERSRPLELEIPYVSDFVFDAFPAPGFRAAALPERMEYQVGPARLSLDYSLRPDGSVHVECHFDCVNRVFTAEEAKAAHAAIKAIYAEDMPQVCFEQIGESLLASGRYREALDEFAALSALHPKEALHFIQQSKALLQAGFTKEALAMAQKAVELEPQLARAQDNLGFVSLHDPFGRILEKGCDLERARAAYAEAERLDPKEVDYPFNQAILLEYGDGLERYGKGARLTEALECYKRALALQKSAKVYGNMAIDYLRLGRYADARQVAKEDLSQENLQSLYLSAVAAVDGAKVALREAIRILPQAESRRQRLNQSADLLINCRLYKEASAFLIEGAKGAKSQTQTLALAATLKDLRPYSTEPDYLAKSPEQLVEILFMELFSGAPNCLERAQAIYSSRYRHGKDDASGLGEAHRLIEGFRRNSSYDTPVLGDLFLSMEKTRTLSQGGARAVLLDLPQVEDFQRPVFYFAQEGGQWRIVGSQWGTNLDLGNIGQIMEEALAADRPQDALDWFRLIVDQGKRDAIFPSLGSLLLGKTIINLTDKPEGPNLRLCAAIYECLSQDPDLSAQAYRAIKPLMADLAEGEDKRNLAGVCLDAVTLANDYQSQLELSTYLLSLDPQNRYAAIWTIKALDGLNRSSEADAFVEANKARFPENSLWSELNAERLIRLDKIEAVMDEYKRLFDLGKTDSGTYNNYLWYTLFTDYRPAKLPDSDVIVKRLMEGNAAELQTLTCYLAKAGRFLEAQEAFRKFLSGVAEPAEDTWVAYGLLAEAFGLDQTGREAYQKAIKDAKDPRKGSSFELAKRMLSSMDKP